MILRAVTPAAGRWAAVEEGAVLLERFRRRRAGCDVPGARLVGVADDEWDEPALAYRLDLR